MNTATADDDVLLELRGVTKRYEHADTPVIAIDNVDLTVRAGELVAIHGPSGAGKTTLLNVAGGLDRPDSGHVRACGLDLSTASHDQILDLRRTRLAYVFQTFALLPLLTAAENIEVPLRLQRTDPASRRQRVDGLLQAVGLAGRHDHQPHQLSGGEQQRVAIARSLATRPTLLLADEPTSQVDADTAVRIVTWLRGLVEQHHLTILLTTHDPDIIDRADRAIPLHDGRLPSRSPAP